MMEKSALDESIILPNFSPEETEVLKRYFEINKQYRDELNAALEEKLKHHPVFGPMITQMPPEVRDAQRERSEALQYAAIYEGKWAEYAADLMVQGRMYARMNISYTDWYELIALVKVIIMPILKRDFAGRFEEALVYLEGLSKFLDYAMYGIAEAYFQEKNEMIRANEEKFSVIFKNSKDHIILVDASGKIMAINHSNFGGPEKLQGMNVADFQGKVNTKIIQSAITEAIEQKKSGSFDTEADVNGTMMYFRSTVSPVISQDGTVTGAVIIARDVTAQKEAELELFNLNLTLENKVMERTEELNIINKELESFTYSVSHDLRSPLRAINGFSEILKMECGDTLSEDANDSLFEILKNTKKMARLIDNLLEFSRLGKQHVSRADVNMQEIVSTVVEDIHKVNENGITFKVGKLHRVNGDPGMLRQVMVNLISNAVKYSSKKPHPVIEIGSREEDGDVIYHVKDNGAGFNMKYYDKLFGIFQRLHGSDEFEGIGVGLALVQRVITRHHGRIWAEGKEEEGATFYFSLPVNNDETENV